MRSLHRLSCLVLVLATGLATPASADVLTVTMGPQSDHFSIAAAVAAAQDGDILLVGASSQGGFTVVDKELTIVAADGAGSVHVGGSMVVRDLAPGRTVNLVGLRGTGFSDTSDELSGVGFLATNNQGQVLLQKCTFTGGDGDPDGWNVNHFRMEITGHPGGWPAAIVRDNPGPVAFNNCFFHGGDAVEMISFFINDCGCTYGEPGGAGLQVDGGDVVVHSSLLVGGHGSLADRVGGDGGAGLDTLAGQVLVSGSNAQGGEGGYASDYVSPVYGGDGGHALAVDEGALLRHLDDTLTGGEPGGSLDGLPGLPGQSVGGAGLQTGLTGSGRGLGVTNPGYDGGPVLLQVSGDPGDVVLLLLGFDTLSTLVPQFLGPLMVAPPTVQVVLGSLPASGILSVPATLPDITVAGALAHLQVIAGQPGNATFTGQATLVLIDDE